MGQEEAEGTEHPENVALARLVQLCAPPDAPADTTGEAGEAALALLWSHLARLIGHQGVRAIFARALRVAQRTHSRLSRVRIAETGLDFATWREDAARLGGESEGAAIVALATAVAEVIINLIGPGMLLAVLGDVELALARRGPVPPARQTSGVQQDDSVGEEHKGSNKHGA